VYSIIPHYSHALLPSLLLLLLLLLLQGPAKYWPDYEGCFHPGVVGGDDSGAMVVLEQFYKSFWKAELGC
jgi:hypothetical protein